MKKIRLSTNLGYGDRALSKGEVVSVGRGKDAVDTETAEAWVRSGLALSMDPQDNQAAAPARTKVVVHERGGQELLQGMTSITPSGKREGPAEENPTDSDVDEDTEEGATRTAAGAVIEENADPDVIAGKAGKGKSKK